jgi:PncC family amidohydrolase
MRTSAADRGATHDVDLSGSLACRSGATPDVVAAGKGSVMTVVTSPSELATEVGRRLTAAGQRIAVAESLTGGLLVQALARVQGSGDWLTGGVVAYRSAVKHDVLGIEAHSVVSPEAAAQMATGVRRLLGAEVAVAVTGVAGPEPQEGRPPGEVWIGVDDGHTARAVPLQATGTPEEICEQTVVAALRGVIEALR